MGRKDQKMGYQQKSSYPGLTPDIAAAGVEEALNVLEGRWKLIILFYLFRDGTLRLSVRLARFAQSLPTISGPQAVGSLERQHPPRILGGKSTDLIQLFKLVLCESEFDRRKIVLKLVETFRANDDRGYHRLWQEPRER